MKWDPNKGWVGDGQRIALLWSPPPMTDAQFHVTTEQIAKVVAFYEARATGEWDILDWGEDEVTE